MSGFFATISHYISLAYISVKRLHVRIKVRFRVRNL